MMAKANTERNKLMPLPKNWPKNDHGIVAKLSALLVARPNAMPNSALRRAVCVAKSVVRVLCVRNRGGAFRVYGNNILQPVPPSASSLSSTAADPPRRSVCPHDEGKIDPEMQSGPDR